MLTDSLGQIAIERPYVERTTPKTKIAKKVDNERSASTSSTPPTIAAKRARVVNDPKSDDVEVDVKRRQIKHDSAARQVRQNHFVRLFVFAGFLNHERN